MSKAAPIGGLPAPSSPRLTGDAELVRIAHDGAIRTMQQLPSAGLRALGSVQLVDSTPKVIAHGLGRKPSMVFVSPPRGAIANGRTIEIRDASHDLTTVIVLEAIGWGATVTVDVSVM